MYQYNTYIDIHFIGSSQVFEYFCLGESAKQNYCLTLKTQGELEHFREVTFDIFLFLLGECNVSTDLLGKGLTEGSHVRVLCGQNTDKQPVLENTLVISLFLSRLIRNSTKSTMTCHFKRVLFVYEIHNFCRNNFIYRNFNYYTRHFCSQDRVHRVPLSSRSLQLFDADMHRYTATEFGFTSNKKALVRAEIEGFTSFHRMVSRAAEKAAARQALKLEAQPVISEARTSTSSAVGEWVQPEDVVDPGTTELDEEVDFSTSADAKEEEEQLLDLKQEAPPPELLEVKQ